jgi:hypothetical protein
MYPTLRLLPAASAQRVHTLGRVLALFLPPRHVPIVPTILIQRAAVVTLYPHVSPVRLDWLHHLVLFRRLLVSLAVQRVSLAVEYAAVRLFARVAMLGTISTAAILVRRALRIPARQQVPRLVCVTLDTLVQPAISAPLITIPIRPALSAWLRPLAMATALVPLLELVSAALDTLVQHAMHALLDTLAIPTVYQRAIPQQLATAMVHAIQTHHALATRDTLGPIAIRVPPIIIPTRLARIAWLPRLAVGWEHVRPRAHASAKRVPTTRVPRARLVQRNAHRVLRQVYATTARRDIVSTLRLILAT